MNSRVKYPLFGVVAILLSTAVMIAVLLAADLYAHHRVSQSAGLNRAGYRGPVAGRKSPGETRIVVLGGSTVFGYGVTWAQAFPAQLEELLRRRQDRAGKVSVVNLGYNNEGVYSFRPTLEDYRYLDYDIAIFYEGYNDLMGDSDRPNTSVFRRRSPIFQLTGYYPILPLVLREKAMAIRYRGDLDAAYRDRGMAKTVFHPPSLARRTAGAAFELAADVGDLITSQNARGGQPAVSVPSTETFEGCQPPWRHYCRSIAVAADYALARETSVIVVSQPHPAASSAISAPRHREQQAAMRAMLQRRYANERRVRSIDLGEALDLDDRSLSYDGMHLTQAGNHVIAQDLVEAVLATIAERRR